VDLKHELEQHSTSLKDSEKKMKYYMKEVRQLAVRLVVQCNISINKKFGQHPQTLPPSILGGRD
jgi:hypothetical protein